MTRGEACYLFTKDQWADFQTLKTKQIKRTLIHEWFFMSGMLQRMDTEP
jgi:hypothetical protein